jgi:hypothetical protein
MSFVRQPFWECNRWRHQAERSGITSAWELVRPSRVDTPHRRPGWCSGAIDPSAADTCATPERHGWKRVVQKKLSISFRFL